MIANFSCFHTFLPKISWMKRFCKRSKVTSICRTDFTGKKSLRENFVFFYTVKSTVWKLHKFSHTLFSKNFLKAMASLKKLLNGWSDKKNYSYLGTFSFFHTVKRTVWSLRKICITVFWKISVKALITRNNSQVIQKIRKLHSLHTVKLKFHDFTFRIFVGKFREMN